jgi:hypothetical protein
LIYVVILLLSLVDYSTGGLLLPGDLVCNIDNSTVLFQTVIDYVLWTQIVAENHVDTSTRYFESFVFVDNMRESFKIHVYTIPAKSKQYPPFFQIV